MKIAQIAPLAESVPPRLYGGTERVVSYLTEELVRLGHQVTLFASGDSVTEASLVACAPRAQRLDGVRDLLPQLLVMLERVLQREREFDVLHFHTEPLAHFPLFRALRGKTVTTLHGRLDTPELKPLFREFGDMPVVSISDSQRAPAQGMNWLATVYHGLSPDVCPFNPSPRGRYFAFLGRVSPEKGLDRAIGIARRAGVTLRIAAKVDAVDEPYFRNRIVPLLGRGIEFLGDVVRHAGARLGEGLGGGDRGGRLEWVRGRLDRSRGRKSPRHRGARPQAGPPPLREAVRRLAHGAGLSQRLPLALAATAAARP